MKIENLIDKKLWDTVESNYNANKFSNAIVDAMLHLTNILREKSDIDDDGLKLVAKIFTKEQPKIQITKLESETEKNMQEGYAAILRGLYQLIRNPRHHEKIEDSKDDAIKIILFIDYVIGILDKAKTSYDIDDIESLIFDEDQIENDSYMKLIIDRIPKRRLYEVAVRVYNRKTYEEIYPFRRFFKCAFENITPEDLFNFMNMISKDLLKTKSDQERKYILGCIPNGKWKEVDEIARLRTENKILKSIGEGKSYKTRNTSEGWFATWCSNILTEFTLKDELFLSISNKIQSNDGAQIRYLFNFIIPKIWGYIDEKEFLENNKKEKDPWDFHSWDFIVFVNNEIIKGNKFFFDSIKSAGYQIPKYLKEYFKPAVNNFIENEDSTTPDVDDHDAADDLPF